MEFDYSWKNPTKAQLAALDFVFHSQGKKTPELPAGITHHLLVSSHANGRAYAVDAGINRGSIFRLSEYELAELIITADKSLWYIQAKKWSENPPERVPETWKLACQFLCQVVELGYDGEKWWNLEKLDNVGVERLLLLDLNQMLKQYRAGSLDIVSRGFEHFIALICDKPFMAKVRQAKRNLTPYQATKCIKPDCDNLVAPIGVKPQEGHFKNYAATGACQRGHNGYSCSKCKKPHSYVSGVGKDHLKFKEETK